MRTPLLLSMLVLLTSLYLGGRHLQVVTHVNDNTYDLLLSILLSHRVPAISVEELASERRQILDARSSREFAVSHIPNALWVGYEDFSLDRLSAIDKHAPMAVYCSVGYRSERIVEHMRRHGYSNVVNVYGGIFEWVNAGHPVVTGNGVETTAVHAYSRFWGIWLKRGTHLYE